MHDIALTPAGRASLEAMHRRIVRLGLLDDRPERVGWLNSEGGTTAGTVLTDEEELRGGPLRYRTRSAMSSAALPEGFYSVRLTRDSLRIQQWDAEDHLRRALQLVRRSGRGRYGIAFVPSLEGEDAQPLGEGFADMPVETIVHLRRLRALVADPPRVLVIEARRLRTRLVADRPLGVLPVVVDRGLESLYHQQFTGADAVRRDRARYYEENSLEISSPVRFSEDWPPMSHNTWPAGPEAWQLFRTLFGETIIMSEGLADPTPDDGLRVELFAEIPARVAPGPELEDYWIFHVLRRVANFTINGGLLYERITRQGAFLMQLSDGPDELRGPDGRVNVLLGAPCSWFHHDQVVWGALEVVLVGVALIDPQTAAALVDTETREQTWRTMTRAMEASPLNRNALRMSGQAPRPAHE